MSFILGKNFKLFYCKFLPSILSVLSVTSIWILYLQDCLLSFPSYFLSVFLIFRSFCFIFWNNFIFQHFYCILHFYFQWFLFSECLLKNNILPLFHNCNRLLNFFSFLLIVQSLFHLNCCFCLPVSVTIFTLEPLLSNLSVLPVCSYLTDWGLVVEVHCRAMQLDMLVGQTLGSALQVFSFGWSKKMLSFLVRGWKHGRNGVQKVCW